MRRLALLLLLPALAGCGSRSTRPAAPVPPATQTQPVGGRTAWFPVTVTVVDGDTHRPVAGARVRVGRASALTNGRGVARLALRRRAALETTIAARGYSARELRLPFRQSAAAIVRVFRPSLQWPMYGVDAQRTQAQTQIALKPPFRVVWSRSVGGLAEFPAVVSDGSAYINNAEGVVQSIDMSNGRVLWRHATPHGEMASSPAVWGGRVVVHGMDGDVWVLQATDGRILSHFRVGSPIESSPLVVDGVDYFGAWNGVVYALDLRTNRLRWTFRSGCKITSSPSLSGRTLYVGDYCGDLLALNSANGRERWSGAVNGRIYGTPAAARGRVFVPSSDGDSMTAFSGSGRLLWQRSFGSYVYSSPAVWGGRVFFGTYGGTFYSLSAANGETLWAVDAGGSISGAAAVVDGIAYAGSFAHRILGVDARTGRVLLDFPHGEYVPVSGDGAHLLLHGYSRIYAVVHR